MRIRDRIALLALFFFPTPAWAALVDSNITGMIRTRNRPWSAKHNAGSHNMKSQELMMASVVDDGSVGLIQDLQRRSTDTNRIQALEVALRDCNNAKVVPELYYTEDKLQEMKLSKLRSIAAGHGASQEAIDEALDHDIPKTALIEVIRTRQNDAEAVNDVARVAVAQGPDAVFGPLGQEHKTVIVMTAILGLVGIATWIKCWIDRYEQQAQSTSAPWFSDRNSLLKIGGVAFSAWLGVGVILSSQVITFNVSTDSSGLPRNLTIIEAFNFAMQIVTTIGWGDMTPATEHGQAFVACYILLGVLLISTIVAEMLEMLFSFTRSLSTPVSHGRYAPVLIAGSQFLTLIFLGTFFYGHYPGEEKSVYEAFYFSVVSLSTVGFGAFAPRTSGGKLFAVFWALAGVASTAQLTVAISHSVIRHRKEIDGEAVKEQLLKDLGEGGKLSMQEFLFFELVRHGFCKEHDLNEFIQEFRKFDKDGSGFLERNDFEKMLEDEPARFISGDLNRVPHMTPGFFSKIVSCKPRFMGGATKPI
jgi:hypothetical protein